MKPSLNAYGIPEISSQKTWRAFERAARVAYEVIVYGATYCCASMSIE